MTHARFAVSVLVLGAAALVVGCPALAQQAPRRPATAPAAAAPAPRHLPLRRIILYKSGVGYFEHAGAVTGNQQVEIDLTSDQLNDVLQSLTALDLGGGRVVGAAYNTAEPLARQLEALPVAVEGAHSLLDTLQSLRGARLEVRTAAASFTGRLLTAESAPRRGPGGVEAAGLEVSLVNDAGELRRFALGAAVSLRFADPRLQRELARALGLLDASRSRPTRRLLLSANGQGERQLQVSYISEVPVWKTTYRIVLPAASPAASTPARLQGWAIVDNTVGEDWNNVALALAAGAPQSFVQQLAQPYYARRPVVPLPQQYQATPQTHASALAVTDAAKQTVAVTAAGAQAAFMNQRVAPMNGPGGAYSVALQPAAQGEAVGELFQYQLRDPVTIAQNHSAMLPILDATVGAERVSLWHPGLARPLRALWLTNSSGEVLDGGSLEILDGDAFGGEGLLDTIEPGDRRLISYATDLGLQVASTGDTRPERVTHISVARGVLVRSTEQRRRTTYTVRNADDTPRTLILEHALSYGWKLAAVPKPEETTAAAARFRLAVPPHQTATLVVNESQPGQTQFALSNLNDDTFRMWRAQREVTPALAASLRRVLAAKAALAKVSADAAAAQAQRDQLVSDQGRVRDDLKALQDAPAEKALAARYVAELGQQETQLAVLAQTAAGLRARQQQAQQSLDALIQDLRFDAERAAPPAAR